MLYLPCIVNKKETPQKHNRTKGSKKQPKSTTQQNKVKRQQETAETKVDYGPLILRTRYSWLAKKSRYGTRLLSDCTMLPLVSASCFSVATLTSENVHHKEQKSKHITAKNDCLLIGHNKTLCMFLAVLAFCQSIHASSTWKQ